MPLPLVALAGIKVAKVAAAKLAPKLIAKAANMKVAGAVASKAAMKATVTKTVTTAKAMAGVPGAYPPEAAAHMAKRIAAKQAAAMARGMARMPTAAGRYISKSLSAKGLVTAGLAGGTLYVAKRGIDTQRLKVETLRASEEFRREQLRKYAETGDPKHLRTAEETLKGMDEIAKAPDLPALPFPAPPPVAMLAIGAAAALGLLLYLKMRR